jgi:hypothetical protein
MSDHQPNSPAFLTGRGPLRRLLSSKRSKWIAAAVFTCAVVGLSVGLATSSSASAGLSSATAAGHVPVGGSTRSGSAGQGSNARSGPARGGAAGTVDSVSDSAFTLTTSAGQKVDDRRDILYEVCERDILGLDERSDRGLERPRTRDDRFDDDHGNPGHCRL